MLTVAVFLSGIVYQYCESWNKLLLVEHHSGKGEMSNKEYEQNLWSADQLRLEAGGCVFEPWTVGTGYVRQSGA